MASIRFVLVRPQKALNIGAAARAMANFGLRDLVLVAPEAEDWRSAASAIYARDLLAEAPEVTFEQAIADCHLVIGTASAQNRERLRTEINLPGLRAWLDKALPSAGRVAVLFGCERTGLVNAEFAHCHALLRIPTATDAPSMNLGQAVALIAYEFSRLNLDQSVREPKEALLEGRQLEGLVDTAVRAMELTGVNAHLSEAQKRDRFRLGLLKWRLSRTDASWLRGLLKKLIDRSSSSFSR